MIVSKFDIQTKSQESHRKKKKSKSKADSSEEYFSPFPSLVLNESEDGFVWDFKELRDGNLATCLADEEETSLKLWSRSGQSLFTFKHSTTPPNVPYQFTCFLELSNDHFATGSSDGAIKVWNRNKPKSPFSFRDRHKAWVFCITQLSDKKLVTGSEDKTIKIWKVNDGKCIQTLEGHVGYVSSVCELSQGGLVSGSGDNTLRVWKVVEKKKSGWRSGTVKEYQFDTILKGHLKWVNCVIQLPSGLVASCSGDETIRLWDVTTGECMRTLTGHGDNITSIVWIEDGLIVSGSADKTVRLWLETGRCVHTIKAPMKVHRVIALRDGSIAYGGGDDKTIEIRTSLRFVMCLDYLVSS